MKRQLIGLLLSCTMLSPQSMVWASASGPVLDIPWIELPSFTAWDVIANDITTSPACFTHGGPLEMSQYYDLSGKSIETGFAYGLDDYYLPCGLGVIEWSGKHGYIDAEGNLMTDRIYDTSCTFEDGLILAEKDGGELLIDVSGRAFMNLSERQLNAYSDFSEGFCAVSSEAEGGNWRLTGYIDKNGGLTIPIRYMSAFDSHDGIVIVQEYYDGRDSTGAVDKEGNVIIPCGYNDVESYTANKNYLIVVDETRSGTHRRDGTLSHSFPKFRYDRARIGEINDLVFVGKNYRRDYLDMDGQEVVPIMYHVLQESETGGGLITQRVPHQTPAGTDMRGTIALDNEMAFVPLPNEAVYAGFPLSEDSIVVKQQSTRGYGYMDQTGAWAVPPQFDQTKPFENEYELVCQDGRIDILKSPLDLSSSWTTGAVSTAWELGLLPRQADSYYTITITRQHFFEPMVCLVETADGKKIDAKLVPPFTDTADIVARRAHAASIVTGIGNGATFSLDVSIIKEQMVVMLCRAVRYIQKQIGRSVLTEADNLNSFIDTGQVSGQTADLLTALTASGISQSTSSTALSPKGTTAAEQAILLTLRAYQEFSKQIGTQKE